MERLRIGYGVVKRKPGHVGPTGASLDKPLGVDASTAFGSAASAQIMRQGHISESARLDLPFTGAAKMKASEPVAGRANPRALTAESAGASATNFDRRNETAQRLVWRHATSLGICQ